MHELLTDLDRALAHNDFGGLRQEQLQTPGVELAVRMALWIIDDPRGASVRSDEVGSDIGPQLLDRLVRLGLRQAWLSFDNDQITAWSRRTPAGSPIQELSSGVAALALGDHAHAFDLLAQAAERTRDAQADHACEARTWLALAALESGDIQRALEEARYTTQLSKQQARPTDHTFSSLTLARARRYAGHPHLSVFITSRLQEHASSRWATWLEWERILAGDRDLFERPRDISSPLARMLMDLFRGDRGTRQTASKSLYDALGSHQGPFASDCLDLAALVDAGKELPPSSDQAKRWARGEENQLPRGLEAASVSAFGGSHQGVEHHPIGVLSPTGGAPRRILRTVEVRELDITDDKSSKQQRTLSAIAYLSLACGKLVEFSGFFEDLYGFAYDARRHQSVLDTLIGRVREILEGRAELVREDNALRIVTKADFFCPDPRCEVSAKDHMLYVLAQGGPATARGLSDHLGMPLRTVQEVLRELKESGACDAQRNGRLIEYSVEDSVYLEPTATLPSFSLD